MKYIKFTILFTVLICFSGKAQSYHRLDSISKIQWLRINIQGALIANNSFSNLVKDPNANGYADYGYTKNNSKPVCFGFNAGIEFLLGRAPRFKQLLSLTYDFTNSLYYDYRVVPQVYHNVDGYVYHKNISRQVQFVNLNYGPLFNITKKLKLATTISVNFCARQTDITNGYYIDNVPARLTGPGPYYNTLPASSDTTNYNNSKTTSGGVGIMVSLKLRASYDVTKYLSVFVQRNLGISYKAPWWMLGLQFYPFKKLR